MFENCTLKYNAFDGVNQSVQITYPNGIQKSVPLVKDNTDYQAILQWVADGNTIQGAD